MSLPQSLQVALKEWAVVCDALRTGRQNDIPIQGRGHRGHPASSSSSISAVPLVPGAMRGDIVGTVIATLTVIACAIAAALFVRAISGGYMRPPFKARPMPHALGGTGRFHLPRLRPRCPRTGPGCVDAEARRHARRRQLSYSRRRHRGRHHQCWPLRSRAAFRRDEGLPIRSVLLPNRLDAAELRESPCRRQRHQRPGRANPAGDLWLDLFLSDGDISTLA